MKKYNTGFTLIELLVAILIFSVVASVIYSTFSTGTSVWKRTKDATRLSMAMNSALQDLAGELRGAVKYRGLEFEGGENKIYFTCLSETLSEEVQYAEVYRVSYYTEKAEEENKYNLFKKKAQIDKGGFNIDEDVKAKLVLDTLDEFKIEYAAKDEMDEIMWTEEWDGEKEEIPAALRIEIQKEDVKLTKYISVPAGKFVSLEAQ